MNGCQQESKEKKKKINISDCEMVGQQHQNAQKVKTKSKKEISEEVKNLRDDNEMLKKQVQELHVIVERMREEMNSVPSKKKESKNQNVKNLNALNVMKPLDQCNFERAYTRDSY